MKRAQTPAARVVILSNNIETITTDYSQALKVGMVSACACIIAGAQAINAVPQDVATLAQEFVAERHRGYQRAQRALAQMTRRRTNTQMRRAPRRRTASLRATRAPDRADESTSRCKKQRKEERFRL